MKNLIATASIAALTAFSAGALQAGSATTKADSAVESEEFTNKAFPDDRGSKNYAEVEPVADENGAAPVTTGAAQGGRDQAVYKDAEGNIVAAGTPGAVLYSTAGEKADSAVESEEYTNKAFPEGRGSKNYAEVEPVAEENGAETPTTADAQGSRDASVYKDAETSASDG